MKDYDKSPKNELMIIQASSEELTEYSLAAQVFLDQSLLMFRQQQIMDKIDEALQQRDKEAFLVLSKQYKELVN
jgi:uncharacterized protein YpiB (UPF0302 family)